MHRIHLSCTEPLQWHTHPIQTVFSGLSLNLLEVLDKTTHIVIRQFPKFVKDCPRLLLFCHIWPSYNFGNHPFKDVCTLYSFPSNASLVQSYLSAVLPRAAGAISAVQWKGDCLRQKQDMSGAAFKWCWEAWRDEEKVKNQTMPTI